MKPSNLKLYGLVALMTLIWSVNFVVAKIGVRSFPPLLIGPMRAAAAALLLMPLYLWSRRGMEADHWNVRELLTLSVLGVFGITLNQIFFVLGMMHTSVAHGALIIATTPVMVMLLAALRGQERVTLRKSGGMLIAIAGLAALNLGPGKASQGASLLGDLCVCAGAFSFSVYTVFSKEVTRRHDSLTVNSLGYLAGALAGAPLLVWQWLKFPVGSVSAAGWWALAYMAALSSVVCYMIFYYALGHMPATRVTAFSYAQPVIAAVAGFLLLGEPVTARVAISGLLVLGGVWLTGRS